MHLFNDTFLQTGDIFLYATKGSGGVGRCEGERERERVRCRAWVKRVAVLVINLTIDKVFKRV
jgi:hypothetical protein